MSLNLFGVAIIWLSGTNPDDAAEKAHVNNFMDLLQPHMSRFGGHPHRCKYTGARPTVYHQLFKTCAILRDVDNNAAS